MGASLVVTARETLEASLFIGILLAYLAQTGNRRRFVHVWLGVGAAAAASLLLAAALLATVGGLEGRAEEAFEGTVMWAAVAVLTYVLWWMGRESRRVAGSLREGAKAALAGGSPLALVAVAFLAVFREGAETALYLSAVAARSPWSGVALGAGVGFVGAALAGYAVYAGGTRFLDLRLFFRATTVVLLVFAAGLVGQATLAYQAAGLLPGTIAVWDTSRLLLETGAVGGVLNALVGYTSSPSLLQVAFWLAYIALVASLYLDLGGKRRAGGNGEPFSPIGGGYGDALYRALRWPRLPGVVAGVMAVLLAALLAVALLGMGVGPFDNRGGLALGPYSAPELGNNLFNFSMWIVWLPLLSVATLVVGRVWCGNLCPLRLATEAARGLADRLTGRGAPTAPYLRIGWLLPASFMLITFIVRGWPVQQVAAYGAAMFLAILLLAVVVGTLFRRGTWCRFICPIGGWLARIARLSPLALRPNPSACAGCEGRPCLTGTSLAGRCPAYLNPSRLESNRYCVDCWACVTNCPPERSSMRLGWRFPGAELLRPYAPDLWESLFVASLLGMYMAVGHRSVALASVPWPALFAGLVAATTAAYAAVCAASGWLAGITWRRALTTLGYVFLPLEFAAAVIAFGDDALEFLGVVQPVAAGLLTVGFVWSVVLAVSILRNQSASPLRALAAGVPVGAALVLTLLVWFQWYASGVVIDLT